MQVCLFLTNYPLGFPTMYVPLAVCQWICRLGVSGISGIHSFPPDKQSLVEELWTFRSQTAGTGLGLSDQRNARHARTIVPEKSGVMFN